MQTWSVQFVDKIGTEDRFVLHFEDIPTARTQPFTRTVGPMTETELRMELRQLEVSEAAADAAIAGARASHK